MIATSLQYYQVNGKEESDVEKSRASFLDEDGNEFFEGDEVIVTTSKGTVYEGTITKVSKKTFKIENIEGVFLEFPFLIVANVKFLVAGE